MKTQKEKINPVKAFRIAAGMTQTEFAMRAGRSIAFVCQVEKGNRRPGPDSAMRFHLASGGKIPILAMLYPDKAA